MSQKLIREQFKKYLDITSSKYLKELNNKKAASKCETETARLDKESQEHIAYIKLLKEHLSRGYCCAFSVCHAAMDCIGKLEWWENVLVNLANWDGSEDALNQPVMLPGSIATDKINTTLDSLFNRALNYIVYHQLPKDKRHNDIRLRGALQKNLLQPVDSKNTENYFEVLISGQKIPATIKNRGIFAGYFKKTDLLELLDENQVRGNICIIGSGKHAIRIGYDGKTWMIYNANYDHSHLKTIHKVGSKNDIITEILASLNTLVIKVQIATIKDDQILSFPYYENMLKYRQTDLIQGAGLHRLANCFPDYVMDIIKQTASKDGQGQSIRKEIERFILEKDVGTRTGLYMLVSHAPKAARRLFKWAAQTKNQVLLVNIAKALPQQNKDKSSAIHILASRLPDVLLTLVGYLLMDDNAVTINDNLHAILKGLASSNDENKTAWQLIPLNKHNYPEKILTVITNNMNKLMNDQLTELGLILRLATYNQHSAYRGLYSERGNHSIFSKEDDKTDIWLNVMNCTSKLLKERIMPGDTINQLSNTLSEHTFG